MAVDALATCVARASTVMILTYFSGNIPISTLEELFYSSKHNNRLCNERSRRRQNVFYVWMDTQLSKCWKCRLHCSDYVRYLAWRHQTITWTKRHCQSDPWNKFQRNLNQNTDILSQENHLKMSSAKMAAILFRSQCVPVSGKRQYGLWSCDTSSLFFCHSQPLVSLTFSWRMYV